MPHDQATVLDIVLACRRIERYVRDHDFESCADDEHGEAVRRLSEAFC